MLSSVFCAMSTITSMARLLLCLLMFGSMSARSGFTPLEPGECHDKQEIPTCESIYNTSKVEGYTYPIPQSIFLYVTSLQDCEYGWYQNGTCIAHSAGSEKLEFVVDASLNLTTRTCERNLSWLVSCENPVLHINNQAGDKSPEDKLDGIPAWGIALIGIGFLFGIISFGIILYFWQNCGKRSPNRDCVV